MKKLNHNDKIIINGYKGHVGTVRGYEKQYNKDPEEMVKHAIKNGHDLYWVNKEPTVLSGDPGHYEREKKRWENVIELFDGEIVEIEGEKLRVKYMGNYSDMIHFKEV